MAAFVLMVKKLKQAVQASGRYPGAVYVARGLLKHLRKRYREDRRRFSPKLIRELQELGARLPRWVELMTCPWCGGTGTQRWMASYRHKCNHCGGWRRVPKTREAVAEDRRLWGTASN